MSQAKVALLSAFIGAVGLIVAAVITGWFGLAQHGDSGNQINQHSTGGNNVACQDHSTCISS
jgi:hypothetical protein